MGIFWCIAAAAFIVVEAITVQLVSIWFAVGALAALLTTVFTGLWWVQVVVFGVVSGLALIFLLPLARKLILKKNEPTNADRAIGKTALVTEEIVKREGRGTVNLEGVIWSAVTEEEETIPAGSEVKVLAIRGVKLLVESK